MPRPRSPLPRVRSDGHLRTRLKVRQLALVVAVAEQRSLRKAAAAIAVTQPAATKLLREVEDAFGVALFARRAWGMEATPYGEALVRYARGMLTDLAEARDEIVALAAGAKGKLRVGGVTGVVPGLLVPALQAVREGRPALRTYVLVNTSEVMIAALRQGTLDVAVGPFPAHEDGADLEVEPVGSEPLCIVARPDHPLARRRHVPPAALADATWIVPPPDSAQRPQVDALLGLAGVRLPLDLIETVSIVATLALVQSAEALSILPAGLARHYEERRQVVRLRADLPPQEGSYMLITRARRPLAPAALDFVAFVRKLAAGGRLTPA